MVAEEIGTAEMRRSPFREAPPTSAEVVIGKRLKGSMKAGQPFTLGLLEEPKAVLEGDFVHVDSINGQAQISFEARAQSGGRKGDIVLIQNPFNGRSFRSRVVGKGKVEAQASLTK